MGKLADIPKKIGPLVLGSFGFQEIHRISWNPPDFMHEIWQISSWNPADFRPWNPADFMKSGRFHAWNSVDFMKSGGFHEIWQISYANCLMYIWNLADFMKFGEFHEIRWISYANCLICIWNLADFMVKSGGFHPWNQADFVADLIKCKLENVKFYNAYNFSFDVNQIRISLVLDSPRLSLWLGAISSS